MKYPSVTQIIAAVGLSGDFSGVPAAVLDAARKRGTAVHRLTEAEHYGYLEPAEITPEIAPYFDAYLKFQTDTGAKAIISEATVVSERWRYEGHIDRVCWLNGRRTIADWKTAQTLDLKPVSYQLAGYRMAWNEQHPKEPVEVTAAVQLKADGTYKLHIIDATKVEHVFQAAVVVIHARGDIHGREYDRYAD